MHSDGWHSALLRRVAGSFPAVRGAIISRNTDLMLDALRAFRHRERNSYGGGLDLSLTVERGHEAVAAFEAFRADVKSFYQSFASQA